MKTIIIDKNIQSREALLSSLKNVSCVEVIQACDVFDEVNNVDDVDLILFDINSNIAKETLEKIKELKVKKENLNFIALSFEINSNLVSETLNSGVNDFLLKPIIPSVIENAIEKLECENKKQSANTIAVFSNKGGVGKTSLVVNLAYELSKKTDKKICILDLSFNSEDVAEFLDINKKFDIDYVLSNIENSNKEFLMSLMSKYKDSNLYLLETHEDIVCETKYTPQKITKIINSLKNIFDYIVIDTSSITNEMTVSMLNNSDVILLVASTNTSSIRSSQKSCELFDKIGYSNDKIKLVINRYIENQENSLDDIEKSIGRKTFCTIPNNYLTLIDAINMGCAVGESNPQSNIAKAYSKIADEVLKLDFAKLKQETNYNHGIFNLLQRMGE